MTGMMATCPPDRAGWRLLLAASCLLMLQACSEAPGGSPRVDAVQLAASTDGDPQAVFTRDTPAVHLSAELVDVPDQARIKATWIAERTQVAPPNYEIDSTELVAGASSTDVDFLLSRPDAGWPAGRYRVDLSIDGEPVASVTFAVAE